MAPVGNRQAGDLAKLVGFSIGQAFLVGKCRTGSGRGKCQADKDEIVCSCNPSRQDRNERRKMWRYEVQRLRARRGFSQAG